MSKSLRKSAEVCLFLLLCALVSTVAGAQSLRSVASVVYSSNPSLCQDTKYSTAGVTRVAASCATTSWTDNTSDSGSGA